MISCVIVFDGRVTRVVYDDTHQWLLESCVKFNQTEVVVEIFISKLRNSRRTGRLFFRAFQCEVELDYITFSRLLIVPVAKSF